jgi:hypothetical protein
MTAVAQAFARMMADKAECELCDMDLSYCEHGLLSRWANLETPRAWQQLGNGGRLPATGGKRADLITRIQVPRL